MTFWVRIWLVCLHHESTAVWIELRWAFLYRYAIQRIRIGICGEGVNSMWYRLLICDLIIPIVMLISGRMMWKHCPKRINNIVGYRTTRSMKNMDTWRFAHDYCGKLWWKTGWVMIIPSVLIHIPLYHSDKNTIGFAGLILMTIQCFIMIASIYSTEKALKKTF